MLRARRPRRSPLPPTRRLSVNLDHSAPCPHRSPTRRGRAPRSLLSGLVLVAMSACALAGPTGAAAADNLPPVAVDDPGAPCGLFGSTGGSFPIPEDWGTFDFVGTCSAIANDTDADGTIVGWQSVTPPAHGTLVWVPEFASAFSYTPDADFSTGAGDWVSDSFEYVAVDNQGAVSNVATFRFWVAAINDAPSFVGVPTLVEVAQDSGPYDADWSAFASAGPANESGQSVSFVIDQVDTSGVPNLFSEGPAFTPAGHLTFTPRPGEVGLATVTVHVHDDGGLENYGIPFLPVPPDDTSDAVTFTIVVGGDGGGNNDPIANDDEATVNEDSGATAIHAIGNDFDPD